MLKDSELVPSLFDFGGQDIFHCIHPFFLTHNGAYMVVFNMEEFFASVDQQKACIAYLLFWINSIASAGL